MTENIENTLNKIIESGRLDSFSNLENLFSDWQKYQHFIDQIQSEIKNESNAQELQNNETFYRLANKFDFDSLLNLIKGLTIIENFVKHGGSVSPVIALYKKLVEKAGLFYLTTGDKHGVFLLIKSLEKNPNKKIELLTHWILKYSKNIYLPFGISTLHSKTIHEIKLEIENWFEKQKEIADREKQEKINKERRDEFKKQQATKNIKLHKNKIISDREYRNSLKSLTTFGLLTEILNNNIHPIYFYYYELNNLENLDSDSKNLLRKVIQGFKENESGKFKKLKENLAYLIEN